MSAYAGTAHTKSAANTAIQTCRDSPVKDPPLIEDPPQKRSPEVGANSSAVLDGASILLLVEGDGHERIVDRAARRERRAVERRAIGDKGFPELRGQWRRVDRRRRLVALRARERHVRPEAPLLGLVQAR